MPTSYPEAVPPPDMLVKLQLCMHATGLQHGYLVCWARMGMIIVKVQHSHSFIRCLAGMLKLVHEAYGQKGSAVSRSLSEMPSPLCTALSALGIEVEQLCNSCKFVRIPGLPPSANCCSACACNAVHHPANGACTRSSPGRCQCPISKIDGACQAAVALVVVVLYLTSGSHMRSCICSASSFFLQKHIWK